jgi:hypothetical protein
VQFLTLLESYYIETSMFLSLGIKAYNSLLGNAFTIAKRKVLYAAF